MVQNPEFATRSWPTVNANDTETSPKFGQQRLGGFGARGVPGARVAGQFKMLLKLLELAILAG